VTYGASVALIAAAVFFAANAANASRHDVVLANISN
jgi:hypothetical protein